MDENRKTTCEEQADLWLEKNMDYVSKCIDEAIIESKTTTQRYTLEESHAMTLKLIEEIQKSKENKKCAS
jgi:hypothetical protein